MCCCSWRCSRCAMHSKLGRAAGSSAQQSCMSSRYASNPANWLMSTPGSRSRGGTAGRWPRVIAPTTCRPTSDGGICAAGAEGAWRADQVLPGHCVTVARPGKRGVTGSMAQSIDRRQPPLPHPKVVADVRPGHHPCQHLVHTHREGEYVRRSCRRVPLLLHYAAAGGG